MKIGFFEIYRHIECLNSFCEIYSNSEKLEAVYIFTTKAYANELEAVYPHATWFKKGIENTQTFLDNNKDHISELDILIIGTMRVIDDFNIFINFDFKPKMILRIHDYTVWFDQFSWIDPRSTLKNFRSSMAVFLKYYIKNGNLFKIGKFLDKMDYLMFYNEVVEDFVLQRHPELKSRIFPTFPITTTFKGITSGDLPDIFTISVPGYINPKRRDYELVFQIFKHIRHDLKKKVHLKILGKPIKKKGHKILNKIKQLANENLLIKTYENRLTQNEFYQEMKSSHILLAPININTNEIFFKSVYGKTKVSGIEDDVLRFQRPVILPKEYNNSKHIEPFVFKYKDEADLSALLLKLINNEIDILSPEDIFNNISQKEFYNTEWVLKSFMEIISC
ncbi:hypothetical protein ACFLYK_03445 [Candidatus Cloacimonadota bacterium]